MVRQATSNDTKLVDIMVRYVTQTERGLCVTSDGFKKVWLPFSQIEMERLGSTCKVTLPEWLAIDKGLENDVV